MARRAYLLIAIVAAFSQLAVASATIVVQGNILVGTGSCAVECAAFVATCPNLPPGNGTTSRIFDLRGFQGRVLRISVNSPGRWAARMIAADCATTSGDFSAQLGTPLAFVASAPYLALSPPAGSTNAGFKIDVL